MNASDVGGSEEDVAQSTVHRLIKLQTFEGYWDWCDEVHQVLDLDQDALRTQLLARYKALTCEQTDILVLSDWKEILATSLVGHYLETRASESKDVWELVKEKADKWVKEALEAMSHEHQQVAKELIAELNNCF